MKRNILITGFDNKLTENVARELADCLSLYYLSIPDLTLYYANRASKEVVLKEGGNKLYEKYVNIAVKDAVEFESMVAAADFTDLKLTHINRFFGRKFHDSSKARRKNIERRRKSQQIQI